MVYDGLNTAVDNLSLGNGTVYNFIDYIGDIHLTGGIARYTRQHGFYLKNITKNYNAGLRGRYGYGSGEKSEAIEKIEGQTGVYLNPNGELMPVPTYRLMIGDYYGVYGIERNSFRDFTTIEQFSALGEALRNSNISENLSEGTLRKRYSKYYGVDRNFTAYNVSDKEIGDDYVSTTLDTVYEQLFGRKLPLYDASENDRLEKQALNEGILKLMGVLDDEYRSKYSNVKSDTRGVGTHQGNVTDLKIPHEVMGLLPVGIERLNFLNIKKSGPDYTQRHENSRPKLYYKQERATIDSVFGDYFFINDSINKISVKNNDGLFQYYDEEREKHGGRNNRTDSKGIKRGWWYGRSYGINVNGPQSYAVGDGRITPEKHSKNTDFTRGSLRTDAHETKSATFTYYNEHDKNGKSSIERTNVSDGFVPRIGNFNSTSRIMRDMDARFNSNEIKSLINRFHTGNGPDEVDADDQLLTAYDPNFGLSRGRNLLRKQYEGSNAGDKSSGFDNPYCRVWTAHHQYAKLKDRIRPFMEGENFMSIKSLQANLGGLRPDNGAQRLNDWSTLQENGFVKITPYHDGTELKGGIDSLKKYMFSIENLAWKGFANEETLSKEQIGPFNGRIMWFPPYNLKFSENINTNWNSNDFIGRGEKIYTYVNTDRGGTLDFTLLIDHPSILNKSVGLGDTGVEENDILRFFAGCGPLDVLDPKEEPGNEEEPDNDENEDKTPVLDPDNQYIEVKYVLFFPNNFSAKKYNSNIPLMIQMLDRYEMTNDGSAPDFKEMDAAWAKQILAPMNYDNKSLFKLNNPDGGRFDTALHDKIKSMLHEDSDAVLRPYSEFKKLDLHYSVKDSERGGTTIFGYDLDDYDIEDIVLDGFASDHGYTAANNVLEKDRATTMGKLAKYFCGRVDESKFKIGKQLEIPVKKPGMPEDVNDIDAKIGRSAIITFRLKLKSNARIPIIESVSSAEGITTMSFDDDNLPEGFIYGVPMQVGANMIPDTYLRPAYIYASRNGRSVSISKNSDIDDLYVYQNEYLYFKELQATDNLVYKDIKKKVQFFNPAYHSVTPEGFNARLNFLQQCTRQGPTVGSHSGGQNKDTSRMSSMAGNLSFGMAPYCILRIGDFFYSKIIIESISINYDNNGGIQWDLNPEGAGVQPMFANVSISFKFIGGQDIEGPVAQLQNAISFNYYANSSIYTHSTQRPIPSNKENN